MSTKLLVPTRHSAVPAHLQARVAIVRKRMTRWATDALLVTNPRDVRYLTGFVGHDSWAIVRAGSNRVRLISDFRYEQQIAREAPHISAVIRKDSFGDALSRLARRLKIERFGIQAAHMTLAMRRALAKKLSARRLVEVDDGLLQQRAVKDAREVRFVCRAVRCQQQAFQMLLGQLKPGQSEQALAARLDLHMRSLGADGSSFETIVAAGPNASLPHAVPGRAKVKNGSLVLFDWGARWDGYCGDLTRVVAVGRMPVRIREVYKIVLDAQLAAIEAIAPGEPVQKVDGVARKIISDAGYGDFFGHGLGHGIGLDIHEQPTLSSHVEATLKPGHVVTVEPGIYLPGAGGVRIEDDVLVTARGRRVLSDLPKDLDSAII